MENGIECWRTLLSTFLLIPRFRIHFILRYSLFSILSILHYSLAEPIWPNFSMTIWRSYSIYGFWLGLRSNQTKIDHWLLFKIAGCIFSWQSRAQKTVALSSTEAEYMALSDCSTGCVDKISIGHENLSTDRDSGRRDNRDWAKNCGPFRSCPDDRRSMINVIQKVEFN